MSLCPRTDKLANGSSSKLLPRFCGPFKIVKKIGKLAYKLKVPEHTSVHPIFHVSRLRKHLFASENKLDDIILVDFVEPPTQSHEPE